MLSGAKHLLFLSEDKQSRFFASVRMTCHPDPAERERDLISPRARQAIGECYFRLTRREEVRD